MGNTNSEFIKYKYNIPITEKIEGETPIYRCKKSKTEILKSTKLDHKTMHDTYKHMFETYAKNPMLGERKLVNNKFQNKYTWINYSNVKDKSEILATNIMNKDLAPEKNEWNDYKLRFIGIYAKNNVKWGLLDFACTMQGITTIPIYDTLGEEATKFAFKQTNMTTLFLTCNHFINMFKFADEGLGELKNLVIFDKENFTDDMKKLESENINVLFFDDLMNLEGEKLPWAEVTPESIYTFSYTSGTTGEPKGAMISHKNMVSLIGACESELTILKPNIEIYLSYLPLAHIFERAICNFVFYIGSRYGYFHGNVLNLKEDLEILKPTIFASVPRLFIKFYQKIKENFDKLTGIKKKLLESGLRKKLSNMKNKSRLTHKLYDSLIFNKTKSVLGGNVKVMLTGSAPIAPEILDFLKVCFSVQIIEGYGQTEGLAAEFLTHIDDPNSGHVGGIYPHLEFKLKDIPDMNYFSTDKNKKGIPTPRGEVWVRGNSIIPGYYKNDAKNKETFTEDGWMLSGDIAIIEPTNNRLKIVDRKKNIFKLSQGEYIAPEKIENAMKNLPFLNEIFVYGDSLNSFIIAVLNIEKNNIKNICGQINIEYKEENINEILDKKEFIDYINKEMSIIHKNNKFNSLERIKKFHIETTLFQDLELLTTSFKLKRNLASKHFENIIKKLYE